MKPNRTKVDSVDRALWLEISKILARAVVKYGPLDAKWLHVDAPEDHRRKK